MPRSKQRASTSWQAGDPAPALVVHPPGAVSLDEAHAAIEQWEYYSRKRLDAAQRLAVEHMMAVRGDGTWAARTTGRAVSRQNGKGDEIEVVEAWDLTQRAAPIVHTAHEIPTAKSAHLRLVAHLKGHRDLWRLVKQVRYANGDQSIEMTNGGIIAYRTRTGPGGRGLDDIARLVVDEAQHAQPEQLASSTPILAVNPNPQTNFMGSAGISGKSAQWWALRKRALAGGEGAFCWLENSAEQVSLAGGRVVSVRPDPGAIDSWIAANPAFPERISAEFLVEQLETLGPELFAREHLCVWDPEDGDADSVFGSAWDDCAAGGRPSTLRVGGLAVAASWDLKHAAIGAAAVRDDMLWLRPLEHGPGSRWVADKVVELQRRHGVEVAVDERGPAADMIPDLEAAGVWLRLVDTSAALDAWAGLYKRVISGSARHQHYPELDRAVVGAVERTVGDRRALGRRTSTTDISPLEAVMLAGWLAEQRPDVTLAPATPRREAFAIRDSHELATAGF